MKTLSLLETELELAQVLNLITEQFKCVRAKCRRAPDDPNLDAWIAQMQTLVDLKLSLLDCAIEKRNEG